MKRCIVWVTTGLLLSLVGGAALHAQVVLSGLSYTENFNSISATTAGLYSWVDNSTLAGWYAMTVNASTQYYRATNANLITPTSTAGSPTSILAVRQNASDIALGSVGTSSYSGIFGVAIMNNTGSTITALTITYTCEQWAWNAGTTNALVFYYSTDATSLTSGTYTEQLNLSVNALYANSPSNVGLNGNSDTIWSSTSSSYVEKTSEQAGGADALNYVTITGTISGLSLEAGETIWLKWEDAVNGTTGQALAIDDLSVVATVIPEPSSSSYLLITFGALSLMIISRRSKAESLA